MMDTEKTAQKINELENEIITLKKALTAQTAKTNNLEEKVTNFLTTVREQKKEVDRLGTTVAGLGHFDSTMNKTRTDLNRKIEETQKQIVADQKMKENLQRDEIKALNGAVEKVRRDVTADFDKKLQLHNEDTARLLQRFKELEISINSKMQGDDEVKGNLSLLMNDFGQYKKRIESFSDEVDSFKKRQDEIRMKQDVILNDLRTNDSRLSEVVNAESDRKQSYLNFIEQQTIGQRERERVWKEWQQQFDDAIKQIYRLLPELQNQQLELNKTKASFEEITQRFDRRINEVTELYRLLDEKFRQEWTTYKADSEKKWSNISVVFDEKQVSLGEQLDKIKERVLLVEDSTHEMQEVLILMSREIQKGMQGLTNMVNGWMDAFGEIKSSR
jgi:DNA repair exonuclease SbcCD ATPase subunit